MRESRAAPLLALAVLSLVWGYNWVVMKEAVRFADPLTFSAMRSFFGGVVLLLIVVLTRRPAGIGWFAGVLTLGLIQTTVFVTVSVWALVYGGAGKTAVLVYTMPMWLMLLAWPILGEKVRGVQWVAVLLALGGLGLILQPWSLQSTPIGAVLALVAALAWAVSGVWAKRMRRKISIDLLALTGWQLVLGSIPLIVLALFAGGKPVEWHPVFIAALAYNIGPATALAWLLWLYALHKLPAAIAGIGSLMTPLVGVLTAWLQLGEQPRGWEQWGIAFIFLGLAITVWEQMHGREKHGTEILTRTD